MIRRVHITNYKCLRDVELHLSPLTVLVGGNSSGKSALLEALRGELGNRPRTVWRRNQSLALQVKLERDTEDHTRVVWAVGMSSPTKSGPSLDAQFLRLQLSSLREANQPRAQATLRLQSDGGNLTNVFTTLTRRDQAELAEQLCRLVPQYRDLVARPSVNLGFMRLELQDRWQEDLWYLPDEVSDGTILTLAFLILRYQKPVPELLLVEEPERGLHPFLMEQLVALARGLSTGAFGGPPIQVVMATHSAELLEHLRPEEVRFLRRGAEDGSTVVESAPTDSPDWERSFEEYQRSLGTAWLSGALGGAPGAA